MFVWEAGNLLGMGVRGGGFVFSRLPGEADIKLHCLTDSWLAPFTCVSLGYLCGLILLSKELTLQYVTLQYVENYPGIYMT